MSDADRRTLAWIAGIVVAVAAAGGFPLVAVYWSDIAGEDATFEDSLLGAALVCVPLLVAGVALWRWGRRLAGPPPEKGAPRTATAALILAVGAILAPWAGALADREGSGIFLGLLAALPLAVAAVATGVAARARSPVGSPARRRATAAAWLGSAGWILTLVITGVAIYLIMDVLV